MNRASPTGLSAAERLRALTERVGARPSSTRSSQISLEQGSDSETETIPEAGPSTVRAPVESSEVDSDVEAMVNHSMTHRQQQTAQDKFRELYQRTVAGPSNPIRNEEPPPLQRPRRASLESPVAQRVAPRRLSVSEDEDEPLSGTLF